MPSRRTHSPKGAGENPSRAKGYADGLVSARARRAARTHFLWADHGILRACWSGFAQVADGVYRANQPSARRVGHYHALGIRGILNLRGDSRLSFHLFEKEACAALGITLVSVRMHARKLPPRETLLELHEIFRTIPRPFLIHCKSGADRTGLVSALYLLMMTEASVEDAMRQLSWRRLHFKRTRAGVVSHLLRVYGRARADTGIGILDWLRHDYDPAAIAASFQDWRAGRWPDTGRGAA